ncbi:MAG: hypothetical protein K8S87_10095, partial [Planctomycetes bacterium]|nr:hypothetical protein [Planctomycetota bacterium]
MQHAPPEEATNPSPNDGDSNIALNTSLSWTNGTNTDEVDVYFSTSYSNVNIKNFSSRIYRGADIESIDPPALNDNTTYYWRVITRYTVANPDLETDGSVWSFTTSSAQFPDTASDPSPHDGAVNQPTSDNLTWDMTGSNTDEYDLRFGPAGNMTMVASGQDAFSTGTHPYTGVENTTYEWQVITRKTSVNPNLETTGAVWSFTTANQVTITNFPYNVDFETGSIPNGWTSSGTVPWTYVNGGHSGHPASAHGGSYNALLYEASTNAASGELISPILDFSGIPSASVSFYLAMIEWPPDLDELQLEYKSDSGSAWANIATINTEVANWTNFEFALPSVSSTTQVKFIGVGQYGYGVCIDDIEINQTTGLPELPTDPIP